MSLLELPSELLAHVAAMCDWSDLQALSEASYNLWQVVRQERRRRRQAMVGNLQALNPSLVVERWLEGADGVVLVSQRLPVPLPGIRFRLPTNMTELVLAFGTWDWMNLSRCFFSSVGNKPLPIKSNNGTILWLCRSDNISDRLSPQGFASRDMTNTFMMTNVAMRCRFA